jgi:predicted NAD-dependent protein-ADP-ribosyltransferase YbiA (DUF1768 family)
MSTIQQNGRIGFYHNGNPYDQFSNVSGIGFSIYANGEPFYVEDLECVFQGFKGLVGDTAAAKNLLQSKDRNGNRISGKALRDAGRALRSDNKYDLPNGNWELVKNEAMFDYLMVKVTQHPVMVAQLIEAARKNVNIVEEANDDPTWGWGPNRQGKNWLGNNLRLAGDVLLKELNTNGQITVRTAVSDNVARLLGHTALGYQFVSGLVVTKQEIDNITPHLHNLDTAAKIKASESRHGNKVPQLQRVAPQQYNPNNTFVPFPSAPQAPMNLFNQGVSQQMNPFATSLNNFVQPSYYPAPTPAPQYNPTAQYQANPFLTPSSAPVASGGLVPLPPVPAQQYNPVQPAQNPFLTSSNNLGQSTYSPYVQTSVPQYNPAAQYQANPFLTSLTLNSPAPAVSGGLVSLPPAPVQKYNQFPGQMTNSFTMSSSTIAPSSSGYVQNHASRFAPAPSSHTASLASRKTATQTVNDILRNVHGFKGIQIVDDKNISGVSVVKVRFYDKDAAASFAKEHGGANTSSTKKSVVMAQGRFTYAFEKKYGVADGGALFNQLLSENGRSR